jgi:hypothetical protein
MFFVLTDEKLTYRVTTIPAASESNIN